jgi:hypothetical protein
MVEQANDEVFAQLPTYDDVRKYHAALTWCERNNVHNMEQCAQRLKQAYGDQPLPAPADAFRRQQCTSVTTTVGRKVRNSGGRLSTEQAYSALRWKRCGIGTSPAQPQPQPLPSIAASASASASPATPPPASLPLFASTAAAAAAASLSSLHNTSRRQSPPPSLPPPPPSATFFQQALLSFNSELQQPSRAHLLHHALPSSINWQVRRITGDGLCWLRTIAAIADPTAVLDKARLETVRAELQQQLLEWGEERWMQTVPWHNVRDWLWGESERRTGAQAQGSYDMCAYLLGLDRWFGHAVFYLASCRYRIEFFLIGYLSGIQQVYHRHVLATPMARTKAVVWHSEQHYDPIVLSADNAAAAFDAIWALPQRTPARSDIIDCDRRRIEQNGDDRPVKRRAEMQHLNNSSITVSSSGSSDEVRAIKPATDAPEAATATVTAEPPVRPQATVAKPCVARQHKDNGVSRRRRRLATLRQREEEGSQQSPFPPLSTTAPSSSPSTIMVVAPSTCPHHTTRTSRRGRVIKQPSRLIQSYLLPPKSRSLATPGSLHWMAAVDTAHAMCVECFRLFVAEQCNEFLLLEASQDLSKGKLEPGQVVPQRPHRRKAAEKAGESNHVHYALCRNDYCALARGRLRESVRAGLRPASLSPESESDQVSGWLHTGMHVPRGGEREMCPTVGVECSTAASDRCRPTRWYARCWVRSVRWQRTTATRITHSRSTSAACTTTRATLTTSTASASFSTPSVPSSTAPSTPPASRPTASLRCTLTSPTSRTTTWDRLCTRRAPTV